MSAVRWIGVVTGAAMLLACTAEQSAAPTSRTDVTVSDLRELGDRFDRAQIEKDRATLERMVADDLVFVGSDGVRTDKAAFIASWIDPATSFAPITITDRTFQPLGPDTDFVGGDVVLSGTSNGADFSSRIRFADTFRRTGGQWQAVHIQATRVPPASTDR